VRKSFISYLANAEIGEDIVNVNFQKRLKLARRAIIAGFIIVIIIIFVNVAMTFISNLSGGSSGGNNPSDGYGPSDGKNPSDGTSPPGVDGPSDG
jgi:hypothetical protein